MVAGILSFSVTFGELRGRYEWNDRPSHLPKRRHDVTFPLLTLHHGKDRVHFSTGFFQEENIVYAGVLQIFRTKNR
jgi:hypothetical protein